MSDINEAKTHAELNHLEEALEKREKAETLQKRKEKLIAYTDSPSAE